RNTLRNGSPSTRRRHRGEDRTARPGSVRKRAAAARGTTLALRRSVDKPRRASEPRDAGPLRRWLARRDLTALLTALDPHAGEAALDVGCGDGRHADALTGLGLSVCAVDRSAPAVDRVRPRVAEAVVADVEELSLGRTFDRVVCFGVLDFVRDP